jgi:restriction system protein
VGLPKFYEFIDPLLRVLCEHPAGIKTAEAYEEVADRVGLSEEEKSEMIPSGQQATYKNRIGWAHDRLKRASLSESADWGIWQITEKGEELVSEYENHLPEKVIDRIARPQEGDGEKQTGMEETSEPAAQDEMTPDERIDGAVKELNDSVSSELLKIIKSRSPEVFEHLVLDVLQAMGYGTGEKAIDHRGGSHDGGIDGVISLDRLGLEKIYIQAKRWDSNTVGRPDLQQFYGALSERHATKGVFITTSNFSKSAVDFADGISDSIVLIDGDELTDLMLEHGVGVRSERTVQVVDINRDYFEPE